MRSARAAVEAALGRPVSPSPIEHLEIPGRLDVRGRDRSEIWTAPHNPAGMQRLVSEPPALLGDRAARRACSRRWWTRTWLTMLSLLATVCPTIIATTRLERRARCRRRADTRRSTGGSTADPHEALDAARTLAGPRGAVVVCGSLYLLHDLID